MDINILEKGKIKNLNKLLNNNSKVIILKKFITKKNTLRIINHCHGLPDKNNNFFSSIDISPKKVKTQRIFRTFIFKKFFDQITIDKLIDISENYILNKIPKGYHRRIQVIHYPSGGGYFDWHKHKRYPTNYGMILNLSKKTNYSSGGNEFKYKNKIIKLKKLDAGDLVLFRYDLIHRVSEVEKNRNLTFDKNGRWTLILPILPNSEKII